MGTVLCWVQLFLHSSIQASVGYGTHRFASGQCRRYRTPQAEPCGAPVLGIPWDSQPKVVMLQDGLPKRPQRMACSPDLDQKQVLVFTMDPPEELFFKMLPRRDVEKVAGAQQ